jgi:hypothetical protein
LVECKLDSKAAQILGGLGLIFVARIIALQLVDFVELSLCIPFERQLKERLFLTMLAMFLTSLTCLEDSCRSSIAGIAV